MTTSPSSCKYSTYVAPFQLQGDRSSIFTSEQAHKCGEQWANLAERLRLHFIACYQTHLRQALASVFFLNIIGQAEPGCGRPPHNNDPRTRPASGGDFALYLYIIVFLDFGLFFFADYATLLLVCKCNYYRMKHKWFIGKCWFDQKLFTARRTHPGEKWSESKMGSRDCRYGQH